MNCIEKLAKKELNNSKTTVMEAVTLFTVS
jgi:hypothetical protein